ncbi:uncharacterized protein Dwil_GK15677, isoform B [Drosophila willistoni]|uniref:Arginyl-tRNA--protein transferase 1 n=1 Tax=Drosophila willistoni TaxID=7260 RepID=A0A0Q9WX41_DROWI|nr:arginyl-tRNA--protein transferase 1 isoform X2 [Drosophila willistoni]KRF98158.1 uncharacterized protein Dwil_GK15677, isoform B [Drosophila willistoni]
MATSIVQYFGEQESKCGYCTGTNCSKSHGMHAYRLDCQDYQDLIDRGWRRCGNYCYKPINDATCCPCYTIKCDALEFKLTKSNKRTLRRINKFLRDGKRESKEQDDDLDPSASANATCDEGSNVNISEPQPQLPDRKPTAIDVEQVATNLAQEKKNVQEKPSGEELKKAERAIIGGSSVASTKCESLYFRLPLLTLNFLLAGGIGSNPPRKKAKQMRLERRQAKLGSNAERLEKPKSATAEKSLRDFLNTPRDTDKHKLKLRLVNVHGDEFKRTLAESYELYKKYQITIHNDPPKNCQAYQDHLQVSPMKHEQPSDGPDKGYGSFHQQYWLDNKLIAVGVIDILPSSVSSVYFFYDPDYSFLSLGTYGSLREIDLVQSFAAQVPELKYYYMGFYIHSCPKMRYKGKLSASYLLCPETYTWLELTNDMCAKLDETKYQRLCPDPDVKDVDEFLEDEHLNNVMLLRDAKSFTTYGRLVQLCGFDSERDVIIEYSKLVGKTCALRMIYVK